MIKRKAIRATDGLSAYLEDHRLRIERALNRSVPAASVRPATIHKAVRYSLLAGGKRLRPILTLAAAEACGLEDVNHVLPAACAVEMIHTYSLIHDDLPCMDDDDLRRGRPTSHKVFGEGIAVLAGDALLTRAFGLIATIKGSKRYPLSMLLEEVATAAGSRHLIAGQVADLEAEGKKLAIRDVRFIHERKTAAMIVLSLRLGAMVANATPSRLKALTIFGQALGLAFQIVDDILDVTQSSEQLGKSAGKDLKASKATYPAVIGLDSSRKQSESLTRKAHASLQDFGSKGELLAMIANHLLGRSA